MKIGFDVISDLDLLPTDNFNWENKATSLYCIVAGNISSDIKTSMAALHHLSRFYQGVFFVPGTLEFNDCADFDQRLVEISKYCKKIRNLILLYQHVVIIDGIAILGVNGWVTNQFGEDKYDEVRIQRFNDFLYLKNALERLQRHLDVKKIILVSNSVPSHRLHFGEVNREIELLPELDITLLADSEHKVSNWVFGTYKKIVYTTIDNINYISNPLVKNNPYWAKRIDVEI
jgi:hypothetical protein